MSEILAPAGNAECAEAAISSGADAIYLGYSTFSARASADNFNYSALAEIIGKAHFSGVKVYVAMNTLVKNSETEEFIRTLLDVWAIGADAIIMQDIYLGKAIHEKYPEIVLHLSTQAGICNLSGAKFAAECGFSRVILARETPIEEIKKIAAFMETEVFVQGALCTCFSGQCYFSSFVGGNSGNRGRCKQPCRKLYTYNRDGFEEKAYALSLSDLCVGERISELAAAGVSSFKIEGRMRRPEYVAAAVQYYRLLSDGGETHEKSEALSALRRTYNRGNYTSGLAFGQDKRFLSRNIQGHLGEKVGVVKVIGGKYYVSSAFHPSEGDAFKILRGGREVSGGIFSKSDRQGFYIESKTRLLNGDGVFVTTDTALNARLLSKRKKVPLKISLRFKEGETAVAEGGGVRICSEETLMHADSRPLTESEIVDCFLKTDTLPLDITFEKVQIEGACFLPKSRLNAFRREFYLQIYQKFTKNTNIRYEYAPFSKKKAVVCNEKRNEKIALIACGFSGDEKIDIAVYKPDDYSADLPESFKHGKFEKYLYYPAFTSAKDEERIAELVKEGSLDGIYAENYSGIVFAKEHDIRLFAGTGFNFTNSISLKKFCSENDGYFALSKELNSFELSELACVSPLTTFVLSSGDVKLMDLCYCPFGKTCVSCDRKQTYFLTDEQGRKFIVRRYRTVGGECRFEVYNCASLIGAELPEAEKLLDCTLTKDKSGAIAALTGGETQEKAFYGEYTFGHAKKSVL